MERVVLGNVEHLREVGQSERVGQESGIGIAICHLTVDLSYSAVPLLNCSNSPHQGRFMWIPFSQLLPEETSAMGRAREKLKVASKFDLKGDVLVSWDTEDFTPLDGI